jgi:SEC-C motif-containing protein
MQARFSAFAVADASYLLETWHPSTRPERLELDETMRWTQLNIVEAVNGGPFDMTGTVEFRAHYRTTGGRGVLHERSNFTRHDGRWRYVSGELKQ